MLGTILSRIVGAHLLKAEWRKLDGAHLQATVEGLAWRYVVIPACVYGYQASPKFKAGLDQIIAAVSGSTG